MSAKKKPRAKKKLRTVGVDKIALALHVTARRVQQLAKEGLPKRGRGKYDKLECMDFYITYLQSALEKKSVPTEDGGYAGEKDQRVRSLTVDADLKEMKLRKELGLVVAIADVEKEMTDLILTTKARIMSVAPRLAAELVGEDSRVMIHAKLEKALKEALLTLSKREAITHEAT